MSLITGISLTGSTVKDDVSEFPIELTPSEFAIETYWPACWKSVWSQGAKLIYFSPESLLPLFQCSSGINLR